MNLKQLINEIIKFSPRDFEGEILTKNFLIQYFNSLKLNYLEQNFKVFKPFFKKYFLLADNKKIDCLPCCFVSGKIESKKFISNVLDDFLTDGNKKSINFNPLCSDFSLACFYFQPALAIKQKDLCKILKSKNILGYVEVIKKSHISSNLLVGNLKNPKNIIFTHYDSILKGAIDNLSGLVILLEIFKKDKSVLEKNLFVFSGSEELSYDKPIYWGYGYRIFEKKFLNLLRKAKKIIVVDSIGCGQTKISKDKKLLFQAFPLKNFNNFENKIFIISGEIEKLMHVYHSNLDKNINLKEIFIAIKILLKEIVN